MPSPTLPDALERAYAVFARHKRPRAIDGSPLKDVAPIVAPLFTMPLRALGGEELGAYAGSAIWTVGSADDYRHFLPRVLELATEQAAWMGFDPPVIARKLAAGGWRGWPADEQDAVEAVFLAAWKQALGRHPDEASALPWLEGMVVAGMEIAAAIRAWEEDQSSEAALHVADFLRANAKKLAKGKPLLGAEVDAWLLSPAVAERLGRQAEDAGLGKRKREMLGWAGEFVGRLIE